MKKSIIALAVLAGSFAGVAQADGTTLYGSVRMAYTYDDGAAGDASSTFADHGSRLGIKGTDELGGGLSAFYKYENRLAGNAGGVAAATTNKLYVGVTGGFGTVSLGLQNTPRDGLGNYSDPTYSFGRGLLGVTSTNNSAAYISPDMSGFQVQAAIIANGAGGVDEHVDTYDILAKYEANGIYAGVDYQADTEGDANKSVGVGVGYGNDQFEVGLVAEKELKDGNKAERLLVRVGGAYNFSENDTIYGSYAMVDPDVKGADNEQELAIGYAHKLSKQTRVWTEYGFQNEEAAGSTDARNKFVVGLRSDF